MYNPAGVKTSPEFPVPEQMKAWVLGSPDELILREKPTPTNRERERDGAEVAPRAELPCR